VISTVFKPFIGVKRSCSYVTLFNSLNLTVSSPIITHWIIGFKPYNLDYRF